MKKKPSLELLKKREEDFMRKCWWLDKKKRVSYS